MRNLGFMHTSNTPKASYGYAIAVSDPGHDTEQPEDEGIERLERFDSLEPGVYWKAHKSIEGKVREGDAHLLMEVVSFEGKPHSVSLMEHPRDGSGKFDVLVTDLMDSMEPCAPGEGEAIRKREQAALMESVAAAQNDLMRLQGDMGLVDEEIRADVEEQLAKSERQAATTSESVAEQHSKALSDLAKIYRRAARRSERKGNPLTAPRIALGSNVGDVLRAGINDEGIAAVAGMATKASIVAEARSKHLLRATEKISATLARMTPYFKETSAVAMARTSAARQTAQAIAAGVRSLALFTGQGVEVFTIRNGEHAPTSEPLWIIQSKRFAEEDLAAHHDVDAETFDIRNQSDFFSALEENMDLVNQILPKERCVVAVAMTRNSRDYGNPYANEAQNRENRRTFLLIRSGEQVHAVYSAEPTHEGLPRLFPRRKDLEQPFTGLDGSRLTIRDVAFGRASQHFENDAIAFRRILILLWGLDERLQLFGEFYSPERWNGQWMSIKFQEANMRFLADEDNEFLLADELMPLGKWLESKNRVVQSGSRVFALGQGRLVEHAPELKRREGSLRAEPGQFAKPLPVQREGKRHLVSVEAHERHGRAAPVSVKAYLEDEREEMRAHPWWLCVDDVSIEEVRRYKGSRVTREGGVGYLMLLRRIETYLLEEAQRERAAREYLIEMAVEHGGMTTAEAQPALDVAIRNWRASRRGAPLPDATMHAELNEILSLIALPGKVSQGLVGLVEAFAAKHDSRALALCKSGKGRIVLYVEPMEADRSPYTSVIAWGWVKRIVLTVGRKSVREVSSSLVWLKALPASEVEIKRWDGLQAWLHDKDEPIRLRDLAEVRLQLAEASKWEATLLGGEGSGFSDDLFGTLMRNIEEAQGSRYRMVKTLTLTIPLAVYSKDGRTLKWVGVTALAERVLYHYGSPAQREKVRRSYVGQFRREDYADARLREPFKWRFSKYRGGEAMKCMEPSEDWPRTTSDDGVSWSTKSVKKNAKRASMAMYYGQAKTRQERGQGGPWLETVEATLSIDRALDALTGRVPGALKAKVYEGVREKIKGLKFTDGCRAAKGDCEAEAAARAELKAELRSLSEVRYQHRLAVEVGSLVAPGGPGSRTRGNRLFNPQATGGEPKRNE